MQEKNNITLLVLFCNIYKKLFLRVDITLIKSLCALSNKLWRRSMSNFHNHSISQLCDDYGNLKLKVDALKIELENIKAEFIKRDVSIATGSQFSLTVATQNSVRLDTKALKEDLGADICKVYETISTSQVVRVKPVAQWVAA